ncbi:hypothetical protein, partial [Desulfovirgula thermocuniculi]|uniref:flagellar motor switch protein FliG n=1 Tax=Desulfovirgula thermocuniculi TaxID=348842 RepID=UPI0004800CA8
MNGKLSGVQKAAIVLIALGAELSAKVLKHFHDDEIELLTQQISLMENVPQGVRDSVLQEFLELHQARKYLMHGGYNYAKELLEKALGPQKAEQILNKVTVAIKQVPFSGLRRTDPRHLFNFIRDEHPQTIALILTYLVPEQAAMILSSLPPEKQSDIARRIALMDRVPPEVVREIENILE